MSVVTGDLKFAALTLAMMTVSCSALYDTGRIKI